MLHLPALSHDFIEDRPLNRVNIKYFFDFGRVIEAVHNVSLLDRPLGPKEWMDLATAKDWVETFGRSEMAPRTNAVAGELWTHLDNLLKGQATRTAALNPQERVNLSQIVIKFNHIFESECPEIFVFHVPPMPGAYSLSKIMENATSHLSPLAQNLLTDKQKEDFNAAGMCLALDLSTASGFHAMRALEEEARLYHKVVTGTDLKDAPLGAIINGDSRVPKSGLRTQFEKEGRKNDSPLGLIISTLSHVNKIYRVRITHPDMTLVYDQAKQVFDLTATALSALAEDGNARFNAKKAKRAARAKKIKSAKAIP